MDLKITPDYLEIPFPRYFREEDRKIKDERNKAVEEILKQYDLSLEPEIEVYEEKTKLGDDLTAAMRFIQKNERGRQGIERCIINKITRLAFVL